MRHALEILDEAKSALAQMHAEANSDDWSNLQSLDRRCRELMDEAIVGYADLDDDQQRVFREQGAAVLQQHQQILEIAKTKLESLRTEVDGALRSERMSKSYAEHS